MAATNVLTTKSSVTCADLASVQLTSTAKLRVGVEVGPEAWQVELGWMQQRLAVVVDEDPVRETWLAEHGWTVLRSENLQGDLAEAVLQALKEEPA